jgi:hypothetical protein
MVYLVFDACAVYFFERLFQLFFTGVGMGRFKLWCNEVWGRR